MSRVDLEQYRASILRAQNSDQLEVVVGELCDAAGYPYRDFSSGASKTTPMRRICKARQAWVTCWIWQLNGSGHCDSVAIWNAHGLWLNRLDNYGNSWRHLVV